MSNSIWMFLKASLTSPNLWSISSDVITFSLKRGCGPGGPGLQSKVGSGFKYGRVWIRVKKFGLNIKILNPSKIQLFLRHFVNYMLTLWRNKKKLKLNFTRSELGRICIQIQVVLRGSDPDLFFFSWWSNTEPDLICSRRSDPGKFTRIHSPGLKLKYNPIPFDYTESLK